MTTHLIGGTLIDGGGRVVENAHLTIEGSKIASVTSGVVEPRVAPDDVVVDVAGATVLPGLMNLHVHVNRRHMHRLTAETPFRVGTPALESLPDELRFVWALKNLWSELLEGVTTFRDTGSGNRLSNKVRWAFASGMLGGPRLVSSGEAIAMTGGHGTHYTKMGARAADGPEGVRRAVREELAAGADWIKLMASSGIGGMPAHEDPRSPELGIDEMAAGVREAHARHARVCAHAYFPEAVRNAVRAGVDCIEHGALLDEETISLMATSGTFYVPTITGLAEVSRRERESGNIATAEAIDAAIGHHGEAVAMAYEAGIRLGTGTDTLGQLVDEIVAMHAAGVPEMDCIDAATRGSATVLGMQDELGTIEPGKTADIVCVDGDPLSDLQALRKVRHVFQGGNLVNSDWMTSSIEDALALPALSADQALYRRAPDPRP